MRGVLCRRCDLGIVGGKWELERAEMPASILQCGEDSKKD